MNIELKDIHLLFNESSGTKARSFTARFLECGLVSYEGEGLGKALLKKENIDKFINKMINCPLIIKHNEVNEENVDNLAVGWITQVSYNEADGWYYCNGIITDEDGIEKAKDFGYVSCAVVPLNVDKSGGVWHDIGYDFEVLDADFNHLALVPNPRYGDATILLNSKMEKIEKKSFKEKLISWLANESGSDNEKKEDGTLVNESEKEDEKDKEKDAKDIENLKNSLKNSLSLKNKSMLKNEDLEALKKLSAYDLVKTMMEEADYHKDNPVSKESELKNESDEKKEEKEEDKKELNNESEKEDKKEELKSCNNASDEKEEEKKEEKEEKKEDKKETLENSTSLGKQLKNSFEEDKPAKTFMSKLDGLELAKKLGL